MREKYQHHIDEFHRLVLSEVNDGFDHIENDLYPKLPAHLDHMEKSLNTFVHSKVPSEIETLIGEISRKLKSEYEYFSIEQSKEEKREKKICRYASMHMQGTAQRFTDEEALLNACFYNLEDDVMDAERRAGRMYDRKRTKSTNEIIVLKEKLEKVRYEYMYLYFLLHI